MKLIFSENVKDVVFDALLFDNKGGVKGFWPDLKVGDLGEVMVKMAKDHEVLVKKKNFWKWFAIGSYATWFYLNIRSQKKISELKLENEVLRDALPEEVDDGHDEA